MITIDIDEVDLTPLITEGIFELESLIPRGSCYARIAIKLFLNISLKPHEIEIMNSLRDYCISESVKDEIKFK